MTRASTTLAGTEVDAADHQIVIVQDDRATHECGQHEREDGEADTERGGASQREHESMKPAPAAGEGADLAGFTDCSPWP